MKMFFKWKSADKIRHYQVRIAPMSLGKWMHIVWITLSHRENGSVNISAQGAQLDGLEP